MLQIILVQYSKNPININTPFLIQTSINEIYATWNDTSIKRWSDLSSSTWSQLNYSWQTINSKRYMDMSKITWQAFNLKDF